MLLPAITYHVDCLTSPPPLTCHAALHPTVNRHAVAKVVLSAPKLAAKAASEATKSKREAAEEVIVDAVQDCLHLMGALKLVLPSLTEPARLQICEHVLAMLILNQPLLTMHGIECLIRAVQGSSGGALPPAKIQQLLSVLPTSPAFPTPA